MKLLVHPNPMNDETACAKISEAHDWMGPHLPRESIELLRPRWTRRPGPHWQSLRLTERGTPVAALPIASAWALEQLRRAP